MDPTTLTAQAPTVDQLEALYSQVKRYFYQKHQQSKVWMMAHGLDAVSLRETTQQVAAVSTLVGSMLVQKPVAAQAVQALQPPDSSSHDQVLTQVTAEEEQAVMDKMKAYVRLPPGQLPKDDEMYLEQQMTDMLGFSVTSNLDGHQLNQSIGIMGGEQHLMRFPGDTLTQHDAVQQSGIAPGRGAFGWFTDNGQLTPDAVLREKYYFAVQLMYLPDWSTDNATLKPWYKFRKMIMINPADGIAIVGDVGDAGPALWVQKQFGGSPEVISEGKVWSPEARGHVILLFVDDPQNKVPLGPIDLTKLNVSQLAEK